MDELRIGQLTKEMVAEELRQLSDPCAAAATVVRKTLSIALNGVPAGGTSPDLVIEDAVKGAMTALLLADLSLSRGAILVIEAVHDVALERELDTVQAMCAALKGLADLRRFVAVQRVDEVRHAIETRYMGAGELFGNYLAESQRAEEAARAE
jgi:hypothetical protein